MLRILFYISIIAIGFILSKYHIIHGKVKLKTSELQSISLFFLLGVMGYKIGSNKTILKEFPKLGFQAFIISIFCIIGSIIITKFLFSKGGDK